jgi:hypothetical protein
MRAVVQKLNQMLRHCEAVSEDHVLFIFRPPQFGLHVGDVIEFDAERLDEAQTAINLTMGSSFTMEIWRCNVRNLQFFHQQDTAVSTPLKKVEAA